MASTKSDSMSIPRIPISSASRANSSVGNESVLLPPKPIDYKKEMVMYFFSHMLEAVVESWDALGIMDAVDSVDSVNEVSEDQCTGTVGSEPDAEEVEEEEPPCLQFSYTQMEEKKARRSSTLRKSKMRKSRKSRLLTLEPDSEGLFVQQEVQTEDISWMIESIEETAIIVFKNGNVYEGPLFGKLLEGVGTFTWANGTKYEGMFKNGELFGEGTLTLSDTSQYTGDVRCGYRHGMGTMYLQGSDAVYKGNWKAGKKHGQGWQLFQPNSWYDGQWEDDTMHGSGTRQYPSGARYSGTWCKSIREGMGTAVMRNNDYYSGEWKDGKRNGFGEYTWRAFYNKTFSVPVQSSYIGNWENDFRHGLGILNFGTEGGSRYVGSFKSNLKHGMGAVICENGCMIESSPLFQNDKPVHLKQTGSFYLYEDNTYTINTPEPEMSTPDIVSPIRDVTEPAFNDFVGVERNMSILKSITAQIHKPATSLDSITLANIELCKMAFAKSVPNYFSMCIPVNVPTELIGLNYYLLKIDEILSDDRFYLAASKITFSMDSKHQSIKLACCGDGDSNLRDTDRSVVFSNQNKKPYIEHEEKKIRKAITCNLPKLRTIYKHYSIVGCLKSLPFKTLLTRMFLWQMYRDCHIPEKGISFSKLDVLMAENPDVEVQSLHSPFEEIYFWQYLHSLVTVAFTLYGEEYSNNYTDGILATAFIKLLEDDIFPNYGKHTGCLLFDYIDVLPLKSAYNWYLEMEQPFTVLTFLQISSTIKRVDPSKHYTKRNEEKNIIVDMGINAIAVAHEIKYLKDELPPIQTEPTSPKETTKSVDRYKDLFFLRVLGAKKILSIVKDICHGVVEDSYIINMDYEMTFYEFYECVLKCTEAYIKKMNNEVKDRQGSSPKISPRGTVDIGSFKKEKRRVRKSLKKQAQFDNF